MCVDCQQGRRRAVGLFASKGPKSIEEVRRTKYEFPVEFFSLSTCTCYMLMLACHAHTHTHTHTHAQGCKRDFEARDRDDIETSNFQSESPRRDRDLHWTRPARFSRLYTYTQEHSCRLCQSTNLWVIGQFAHLGLLLQQLEHPGWLSTQVTRSDNYKITSSTSKT